MRGPNIIRGASPLGPPDTLSRSPRRRLAPFAWLARSRSLAPSANSVRGHGIGSRFLAAAAAVALAILGGCAKTAPVVAPAPAGSPAFADYLYPAPPAGETPAAVVELHANAWHLLQAGDARGAERDFKQVLKEAPAFYPAETGLGYAALLRKDAAGAVGHFDASLTADPAYAPALAGKGQALLSLGRTEPALEALEAAVAADPGMAPLRSRIDVLKFRNTQDLVATARRTAAGGKLDEAQRAYEAAIVASPESAFLYRELAVVRQRAGDVAGALVSARKASELDPSDAHALRLIAELYEQSGEWGRAADAYAAVAAVDPGSGVNDKVEAMREKAALATLPEEYQAVETAATVTRAQLAALLGVRLRDLLAAASSTQPVLMTDTRGSWATPWIMAVTRAGVMEPFPNHAFQPGAVVDRADLAQAVSRVLGLIASQRPRVAARWRDPRPHFSDLAPTHLVYPAAARAVSAGVMTPAQGDAFEPSRPVTGSEALDAVSKLADLVTK